MAFEIVVAGPEDFPEVLDPAMTAFGTTRRTDEELADSRDVYQHHATIGAREDGRWVGTTGVFPFHLTVPGGTTVPAAGITAVGVLPTHRRRGIASALMARSLDDAVAASQPVAILLAMEASIYGRFGYGVATEYASVAIDAAGLRFSPALVEPGAITLHDHVEGTRLAAEVWERYRRLRPGAIDRMEWMWERHRRDRERERDGAGAQFWVVHTDAAGRADGFARYRIREHDQRGVPRYTAIAHDVVGTAPEVEALLVRYLCSIDLVRTVEIPLRPVDDPLRWRVTDRRHLSVTELGDFLWVRVLDVSAAFGARRYGVVDDLVVEVVDAFRPASGGRFAIAGGPDGADVTRTGRAADLVLDASSLGSLLLGTVAPSFLAEAGRVQAAPEALARADAFFASHPAPFACTEF